jgi:signal transduction histidine kinase/CheY-like chemotaxis protein
VWADGKPSWIADVAADMNFPRQLAALQDGLHGAFAFPIILSGEVVGVLEFFSHDVREPDADLLEMAATIGGHIGLFMQRQEADARLREADRRKDEFLATLAHELRNPLAPLRNSLAILKTNGTDGAVAGQTREIMERQLNHLVRLVDDLMDVSRIMRGKITLRRASLDLALVVARAVEIAHPMIDAHGHKLIVALPPEPLRVNGDEIRLAQVVANLLNNAAKYSDKPGRIWLSASRQGADVELRVKDEGIGIAAGMLPRVFELFIQAARAGERAQGGLGIGLSLCKRLVEIHGGTIAARSAGPGQGSEFIVRLPALLAPDSALEPMAAESTASPVAPRCRVLCVDDNVDACTSLAMMLQLSGHEAVTANDGPAALATAASYQPDIVLLDIGLPGMDGYEVCKRLRAEPKFTGLLIVALTGWGQEEDRRRSQEAGFDLHVTKPIDPQYLEEVLRTNGRPRRETAQAAQGLSTRPEDLTRR